MNLTHSKVTYLFCWGALAIAQAWLITKSQGSIAPPPKLIGSKF